MFQQDQFAVTTEDSKVETVSYDIASRFSIGFGEHREDGMERRCRSIASNLRAEDPELITEIPWKSQQETAAGVGEQQNTHNSTKTLSRNVTRDKVVDGMERFPQNTDRFLKTGNRDILRNVGAPRGDATGILAKAVHEPLVKSSPEQQPANMDNNGAGYLHATDKLVKPAENIAERGLDSPSSVESALVGIEHDARDNNCSVDGSLARTKIAGIEQASKPGFETSQNIARQISSSQFASENAEGGDRTLTERCRRYLDPRDILGIPRTIVRTIGSSVSTGDIDLEMQGTESIASASEGSVSSFDVGGGDQDSHSATSGSTSTSIPVIPSRVRRSGQRQRAMSTYEKCRLTLVILVATANIVFLWKMGEWEMENGLVDSRAQRTGRRVARLMLV